MWTGGCFWMILYAEEELLFVFNSGNRLIIQIEVENLSDLIINAFRINTESVGCVKRSLLFSCANPESADCHRDVQI